MAEHVVVTAQTDPAQAKGSDVASVVDTADSKVQIYVRARLEVWNTGTLQWDKMTQPGGGGGGAVTIADGADVTQGALADAAVGDASGSVNAHLRQVAKSLIAGISVTFPAAQHVIVDSTSGTVDVSDRVGRLVGHVNVDNFPADQLVHASNLDVALSTRLKPADTLAAVTAITNAVTVNGDVDHDAVNTLKNVQIAGDANPPSNPPAAVSAVGDRVRAHLDRYGAQIVRRRKLRTSYTAVFRLAETAARLDQTFTQVANTNKQWATLHHAATATKELSLQRVVAYITAWSVATQGVLELRELSSATPPLTGNPAITGRPHFIGAGAHEATALYLPGTQGSEAAVNSPLGHQPFDYGIMGAVSTVNPMPLITPIVLYDASVEDDQVMSPTAPVGVYGGWAVMERAVGAPVIRMTVVMKFTEEIP